MGKLREPALCADIPGVVFTLRNINVQPIVNYMYMCILALILFKHQFIVHLADLIHPIQGERGREGWGELCYSPSTDYP